MKQHWAGLSFATWHRRAWKLIYYEAYLEEGDAFGRERYLKSGAADGCYGCNSDTISGIARFVLEREPNLQPRERSFYAV